ncbi:MAG: TetR/AcrR family transcriptional regulator [Clostridia bacterium]|nr:TetR/AcrR family transcriptional regulator [Clostridia bacterium]
MEKIPAGKKTDRRTLYTKEVIKSALLELIEDKPFEKITITEVCKRAEINRGTYYLHYYELSEVLDELLNDAMTGEWRFEQPQIIDAHSKEECPNSLCKAVRHNEKYRVLFMNESLTGRIVEKLASIYKDEFTEGLMTRCKVSRQQAEAVFYFQIQGCFAISKSGRDMDCDDWIQIRNVIDKFVVGGIERLASGT